MDDDGMNDGDGLVSNYEGWVMVGLIASDGVRDGDDGWA